MTEFPRDEATIRVATRDQYAIRYAAHLAGQTVREYLETLVARHADRLEMPPIRWTPPPVRPKRTNTEVATARALASHGRTEAVSIQTGIRPERLRELRGDTKEQNACQS